MEDRKELIRRTIELAVENVKAGAGGPFGALVVKEGKIIATGTNLVTSSNDPTAHAEVVAIRRACQALGNFELAGCEIYCSCEPCPMCLGAIYWARPARVYFAACGMDAAQVGFDDTFIKEQFALPYGKQRIPIEQLAHENSLAPFQAWKAKTDKIAY
jgi:tRNA(Arg) A34 adenosine deaminase TadA